MPRKAAQKGTSPSRNAKKAGSKKGKARQSVVFEEQEEFYSTSALHRLLHIVNNGIRLSASASETCKDLSKKIVFEMVKLSACSAVFNGRRTLTKADAMFACNTLGFPVLASAVNIKRLRTKVKAEKKENPEGKTVKFKNSTISKRKSVHYQKEYSKSNVVVFPMAPLKREIGFILQENLKHFGFEEGTKVKLSDDFKKLFQFAFETVLLRILRDAYTICLIANAVTIKPVMLNQAAANYLCGALL